MGVGEVMVMQARTTHKRKRVSATEQPESNLSVIHLDWDDALALHHSGGDSWSAMAVLDYLAERAHLRGERDRATALLDAARRL